jgi:putative PIG3 family NAD(P)H quinone oxidoreductase
MTMRAVVVSRPGPPEVLTIRDVPVPRPGPGEIRVRVRAFGINRADLLQRRGLYPAPADAPPDIPGLEFAGEVDHADPGAAFHAGDRVMGIAGGGTYAEYVVVPGSHAVRIPAGLAFPVAAAVPEAFVTAHDALRRGDVGTGTWVLVHAVGSGVGIAALQVAAAWGAHVIGTSRTPDKLVRARALGLDVGCHAGTQDFVAMTRKATGGEGADAAIDLVGGAQLPRTLEALRERGRLVLVGLTGGATAELDLSLVLRRRLRVEGTVLRARSRTEKAAAVAAFADDVLPLLASGAIRPVVDRVFPLDAIADAHRTMEANATFGKLVVEMP